MSEPAGPAPAAQGAPARNPGVMLFEGRIVCYEEHGLTVRANELGRTELLPVNEALRAAIRRDRAHARSKAVGLAAGSAAEL